MNNDVQFSTTSGTSKAIIIYKLILGIAETLLGLGILFWNNRLIHWYRNFREAELLENSHDLLVFILERIMPYFVYHHLYVVTVLLLVGLVKIVGSIGLLYKKQWGLHLIVGLVVFFLPFDLAAILLHPSVLKIIYFLLNVLIALYLVQFKPKEYILHLKKYFTK